MRLASIGVVPGKLASACRFRASCLLVLLLPALLGACSTVRQPEPEGRPKSELWPQPIRSIGLMAHTASLALGLTSLGAGPPAATAADAPQAIRRSCDREKPGVTWLGHSSAIINIGGQCILTDPILISDSPEGLLPKRLTPWAASVDDLPGIDAIIFSHGDYDHLHAPTLRLLANRFPHALVLAPTGVAARIAASGYPDAHEMRDGEAATLGGIRILALPAYHDASESGLTGVAIDGLRGRLAPHSFSTALNTAFVQGSIASRLRPRRWL